MILLNSVLQFFKDVFGIDDNPQDVVLKPKFWNIATEEPYCCPNDPTKCEVGYVEAGMFSSTLSQEDANSQASIEAIRRVQAVLIC